MNGPWTHEQLQRAIYKEVAAVAYAQTHDHAEEPAVDEVTTNEQAQPNVPTVVVGIDRSPASDTALAWAAAEAVRRGGHLILVRAMEVGELPFPTTGWDEEERTLAALAASVRDAHPCLKDVTSELAAGSAGPVLVERAADADLLVVGTHGRGLLSRAVLGSTSAYCAVHAAVPTTVVPREWSARRRPES